MSKELPFFSVIVPVYNGERTIGDCIKSLLSLNYPSSNYEIIIVDNNSKDNTNNIIRQYPVTCLLEDNIQSSYAARNTGIKRSKGEIIAFTDSDCIADKDWILKAVECFEDKDVGCVAGRIEGYSPTNYIEEYLKRHGYLCQDTSTLKHWFLPYAQTANAIYRREVLNEIGFFEERWVSAGDTDLTWRMLQKTRYKLTYGKDSLIHHVHRSTLKGLFNQRKTWGYGELLLYKKHKVHYFNPDSSLAKEIYRDYKEFLRLVIGKFPAMLHNKWITRNEVAYQDKKLSMIGALGRRIGRIKGSIRERIFYV
jgi:cellulose synthase/poly-beta-1,6-N-acetylglucosamine synthase-like glycosyltransferase